jgi:hypothetical protein
VSISSVITGGFGVSAPLIITDGFGTTGVIPPPPADDIVPTTGGWRSKYDKKKRKRVIRYSDFATREDFRRAVQQAIPIPRPPVVDSLEDLEDEDFIVTHLLRLLDD